jgi:hypothetical protein
MQLFNLCKHICGTRNMEQLWFLCTNALKNCTAHPWNQHFGVTIFLAGGNVRVYVVKCARLLRHFLCLRGANGPVASLCALRWQEWFRCVDYCPCCQLSQSLKICYVHVPSALWLVVLSERFAVCKGFLNNSLFFFLGMISLFLWWCTLDHIHVYFPVCASHMLISDCLFLCTLCVS